MKTTSALAIAAAAGLFLAASPAKAADLGGDCCADLEERVAELEATTVRKGNKKVSVTLYGQVNRALLYWDDGVESDVFNVDNDVSSTRLGVRGGAKFAGDFSMGYNIEFELQNSDSNLVNETNDDNSTGIAIRHANVSIGHKAYGKFTIGQQSVASDGITEIDLGGTGVVAGYGTNTAWNGSFAVRGTALDWDDVVVDTDGTRRDVIRYDSPTLAGFTVSASWGESDLSDVALRYAEEYASIGLRVAAGIAYTWGYNDATRGDDDAPSCGSDCEVLQGSISLLHTPTGLNLTFAAGDIDEVAVNGDKSFYAVKAGIFQKFFDLGKTAIYAEYYESDLEGAAVNDGATFYGAGLVQNIDDAATELYLSGRLYEVNDAAVGAEDFLAVIGGARIRF